jgi:hypothetical protein
MHTIGWKTYDMVREPPRLAASRELTTRMPASAQETESRLLLRALSGL